MAAATITGRLVHSVIGDQRVVSIGTSAAFAANGDTWIVPGLKAIYAINLAPTTAAAVHGFTRSGGTITLVSGGAVTFTGQVVGR
ncbi:MAG TPA: hypothetical protein VFC19_22445 [Candidatus Limnocylindrales bacterium]|nr:hypothetical protein [Candidatus Limnocylindrales bacterium]